MLDSPRARLVVLSSLSALMGALLGFGVARSLPGQGTTPQHTAGSPEAGGPWGTPLGAPPAMGPKGATGLPPLPAGVKLDERGVVQGIARQVAPGTVALEWETLRSFEYSQAIGMQTLPPEIAAVDGKRVTMVGFLQPLYEFDDIHQFALVGSHWSCCFGYPPGLTGVVNVTLAPDQAGLTNTMEPLRVVGTFYAKETKEEGWLISVFSIEQAEAATLR